MSNVNYTNSQFLQSVNNKKLSEKKCIYNIYTEDELKCIKTSDGGIQKWLNYKHKSNYYCNICGIDIKQKSHIKEHLKSSKHKDKVKILDLEIKNLSEEDRINKYGYSNVDEIIKNNECIDIRDMYKKYKSNEYIQFEYIPEGNIVWEIEDNQEQNSDYQDLKRKVESIVKQCHQILYSNASIVGIKAMNDIIKILILKFLENQFKDSNSEIWKMINLKKDSLGLSESKFKTYIELCKNIKLFEEDELKFNTWRLLVRDFLTRILPNIFSVEDESFKLKDEGTFIELINKISSLNINQSFINTYSTACGDIHETFRAYCGKKGAKELGQFFTPRKLIHLIFHGIKFKEICTEIEDPEIFDPCMGTGGFLTRMYKLLDIKPENIYGCETELDTIKFAFSSVQLTTGSTISNLEKCNSLCASEGLDTKKHNIIVTNPPFGTSMNYDKLKKKYESNFSESQVKFEDIYPEKINNGACLFTQMCVHKLAEGGVCAIVLPDGELFNGGKWARKFRKWLCANVNIRTILKVPSGTFDHASVKTNVVIFTKDGPTKNIKYLQTNKECNVVKTLFNIPIEDLEKAHYHLDSERYGKQQEENYEVPIKTLEEVCKFEGYKALRKIDFIEGPYKVIGGGRKPAGFHNQYNKDANTILCAASGNSGFISKYNEPIWASECFSIHSNDENLNEEYLYYFLKYNQNQIYNLIPANAGRSHMYPKTICRLKIPIPSLEVQIQIIQNLSQIEESERTIEERILQLEREKKQNRKYYRIGEILSLFKDCERLPTKDLFEFEKGKCQSTKVIEDESGEGKMITLAKDSTLYKNITNYKKNACCLFIGNIDSGKKFVVRYYEGKCDWINILLYCNFKINVMVKFIYYYLLNMEEILTEKYLKGSSNLSLDKDKFNMLKIPIPTQEVQQQCVEIYEDKEHKLLDYDIKIQNEKDYIEELKQLGKDVIYSFCSSVE